MKTAERIVLYFLLISLPLQVGKHFWPNFSFVQGIRLDYLSPTIYLSDLLLILLIIISLPRTFRTILLAFRKPLAIFFIASLIVSTLMSLNPLSAIYGIFKLFEFVYLALYISLFFKKEHLPTFLFTFTLGGLVQIIILLFQFISQRSIGGSFYFFGERTFDSTTPGIALFNLGQHLLLRPYGTFPHPNVLAFYLLFGFVLILFSLKPEKNIRTFVKCILVLLFSLGIFLTFSRVIIILLVISTVVWLWVNMRSKLGVFLTYISLCMFVLFLLFYQRYIGTFWRDIHFRLELLQISWVIFLKNPLIGIGLNNFFYHEVLLQKSISPTLLQPVHNIYMLWLCMTGIIGSAIIFKFSLKLFRVKSTALIVLLGSTFIVGLFDHYLITLQQGQLLFAILVGLCFSEIARIKNLS